MNRFPVAMLLDGMMLTVIGIAVQADVLYAVGSAALVVAFLTAGNSA